MMISKPNFTERKSRDNQHGVYTAHAQRREA